MMFAEIIGWLRTAVFNQSAFQFELREAHSRQKSASGANPQRLAAIIAAATWFSQSAGEIPFRRKELRLYRLAGQATINALQQTAKHAAGANFVKLRKTLLD